MLSCLPIELQKIIAFAFFASSLIGVYAIWHKVFVSIKELISITKQNAIRRKNADIAIEHYDPIKVVHYDPVIKKRKFCFSNDCFIVALTGLTGKSWKTCFNKFMEYERDHYCAGTSLDIIKSFMLQVFNYDWVDLDMPISKFIKENPKGKFIIIHSDDNGYNGHAVYLKDGVIYDPMNSANYTVRTVIAKKKLLKKYYDF